MPKTKSKKSDTETSDSDSGPDDKDPPPKAKKAKADSEDDKKSKKDSTKSTSKTGPWTLEGLRQVSITEFRGRKYVDIREFYAKGADILPGKKGISLSITQWRKLMEVAEEVTAAVENQ